MGTRRLAFEMGRANISPPRSTIYRVLAANATYAELNYQHQHGHAEDAAGQQVDDLEQHLASQPSPRPACWR